MLFYCDPIEIDHDGNMGEHKSVEHFELMQFTGLTDKNGTEIYEGDVICVSNNRNGFFQVVFVNAYVGGWVLKHDDDHDLLSLGARKQDDIEVIGNIHENPELLNT